MIFVHIFEIRLFFLEDNVEQIYNVIEIDPFVRLAKCEIVFFSSSTFHFFD